MVFLPPTEVGATSRAAKVMLTVEIGETARITLSTIRRPALRRVLAWLAAGACC